MGPTEEELEYYRTVEDLFATLRGTPHVLSPKDFQLLRSWWRDSVPLAAVVTALTEVFARSRERGDEDPVVSLSYCRHAVTRHASRLARMQVGSSDSDELRRPPNDTEHIAALVRRLIEVSRTHRDRHPAIAEAIAAVAEQLRLAGRELPPALLDEHLFALESTLLEDCRRALPDDLRKIIEDRVDELVGGTAATDEARRRSARAVRDRETRRLLDIPRLELGS